MPSGTSSPEDHQQPPSFTIQDLGEMILDLNKKFHSQNKAITTARFDQEALARHQELMTKQLQQLLAGGTPQVAKSTVTPATPAATVTVPTTAVAVPPTASRGWKPPPSRTVAPASATPDSIPKLRIEAPRFNGEDAVGWIRKIQKYFNHFYTPESGRLYAVTMLFDPPASDWLTYWEENNPDKGWEDFLFDFKYRFDPDLYGDYVGRLANLHQSTTVEAYQFAFETMLQKVSHVDEATLMSLFIAGLKQPVQKELSIRRPGTLQETFALARQIAECHAAIFQSHQSPRSSWTPREQRQPSLTGSSPHQTPSAQRSEQPAARFEGIPPRGPRQTTAVNNLPIVRVTAAERAERTRKGLCWYCEEAWSRSHVCSKKFLALMGADEDDVFEDAHDEQQSDDEGEAMIISGDLSSIHSLLSKTKPRSLRLKGCINDTEITVLIDGGSTHNFIKPTMAEKLSLPLQPITPFRVFVGNGASLKCSYVCLHTPLSLQGHTFDMDLFVLQVEGPDVILGVQWLQELGDVTKNYKNLTMKFEWDAKSVFLQGEGPSPRAISYNSLFSMLGEEPSYDLFEIVAIPKIEDMDQHEVREVHPMVATALTEFQTVFAIPSGLPPSRKWDHKIHLAAHVRPINVRPYRYPYFQKAEIEKQIHEMLEQGVIQHSTSPFSSPV